MDMAKAGFARSFVTAGQGLKQAGTEAIRNLAGDKIRAPRRGNGRIDNVNRIRPSV